MSGGNPAWTRDEVVLALDLYFDLDKPIRRRDPRIAALSREFQLMARQRSATGGPNLRNPTSVYFKMNNFLELDPQFKGTGFPNHSALDGKVWHEFLNKRESLRKEVRRIRSTAAGHPNGNDAALSQEAVETWDEVVRRHRQGIPADKTGPFSIAEFRARLRPLREELRDAIADRLAEYPRLSGLKSYSAGFWQQGPKGAALKGYIWNFLAPDNAKTRARLQTTFTIDQAVRAEYVAYPALDPNLKYDIARVSATLKERAELATFHRLLLDLPRGFFLFCKLGDGSTIDEFVDEIPGEAWDKILKAGIAMDAYFTIGTDRPRQRLSHLSADALANILLADLSDLAAIRNLFEGNQDGGSGRALNNESAAGRARRASAAPARGVYRPEFSGKKSYTPPTSPVEADCRHGNIVDALAIELASRGIPHGNDQLRDLYILKSGRLNALFEVKTDLSTSSIYAAIGQLMLHGAAEDAAPVRIAVFPGDPDPRTIAALKRLDIKVIPYEYGELIAFHGLDALLQELV